MTLSYAAFYFVPQPAGLAFLNSTDEVWKVTLDAETLPVCSQEVNIFYLNLFILFKYNNTNVVVAYSLAANIVY